MIALKYLCQVRGLSKYDLAEILDLHPKTVNNWFVGAREIPQNRLYQLSSYFEIDDKTIFSRPLTPILKHNILMWELQNIEKELLSNNS